MVLLTAAAGCAQALEIFSRGAMEDIDEDDKPKPEEKLKEVRLFALRGEYEPFTFAVHNPQRQPAVLEVSITEFTHETDPKRTIPASSVEVMGLRKGGKLHRMETKDWYLVEKGKATAPSEGNTRFWLTVCVPKDAEPGVYKALLTVQCGTLSKPLPVTLHVSKAELKDVPGVQFCLLGTVSPFGQYYHSLKPEDVERLRPEVVDFYSELKTHGMTCICTKTSDFPYMEGRIDGLVAEVEAALEAGLDGPIVWNMMALIDAAKGGDRYDFNGRMDNWEEKKDLERLRKLHTLASKTATERKWPEIIYYAIDEPGTQFDERRWLLLSMEILEKTSRELRALGVRSHSTITEMVDEKHNKAPRWSRTPDEMRRLWDRSRPYLSIRNYGYGYPQGKTSLLREMEDAKRRGQEVWCYNNGAIMGANRYCARMYFGLWSWKVGLDGVTAWTYPGGRTLQFEMVREGIDDHKALALLGELAEKGRGKREDRDEAKQFLDELRASIKLDENGFIGDWAEVAQQSMKAEKLGTDWKAVDFGAFKARLVDLIDRLKP